MSKAAELIAGLQREADFDSDGGFTLDREKAREKMRQFQLADPHRYVLLLVEAAALRGATRIRFDIDSDDMRMHFDAALEWADLDELYASLFVDRTSVAIRARRELALAANAVMALNPRYCKITSVGVDAETGAHYGIGATLRSGEEDVLERFELTGELPEPHTTVHVKERFRPGLLVRFVRDVQKQLPEELLIESRCAHASIEIELDGRRISQGLPAGELIAALPFEGEHLRGLAGIVRDRARRQRSVMVLLSNGVEIATHELAESVGGLWFWIDAQRLRKDVSQADVVRNDPGYEAMLRSVAAARDQVLGRLVELWSAGTAFTDETEPSQANVFDLLRGCFLRWADASWLAPNAGVLGKLAQLPLWRLVDGKVLSPLELREVVGEGSFGYSTRDFEGVMPQGWKPVILVTGGELEREAIERVYPEATDMTERLARCVPWELNRRAWRARPHALALPATGSGAPTLRFEQGESRGLLRLEMGGLSNVRVLVEGCVLTELALDLGLGYASISAIIAGPLQPLGDYTRPHQTRAYASVLLLLLAELARALEASAEQHPSMVLGVLKALTRPDCAREWLETFGFSKANAEKLLARLGAPRLLPDFGLRADDPSSPLNRALRFRLTDGRELDLVEIELLRREREGGQLLWVDRARAREEGSSEDWLLHLSRDELRVLKAIFGDERLRDQTQVYLQTLRQRAFLARPRVPLEPPQTTWTREVSLSLEGGGRIHGYVGVSATTLRTWSSDQPRRAEVEVHVRERRLCRVDPRSWIPGVEAALSWEQAPVNEDFDGLEDDAPLSRALELGLIQLLCERAEAAAQTRPNSDERRLLWMGIVSPFVCAEQFAAFRMIRREGAERGDSFAEAARATAELLELYPGVALGDLREALSLLIQDGRAPTRAAVVDLLGAEPKSSGGREFQRMLLERFELLEQAKLLSSVGGESLSLAQLVEDFERSGELAYVEDASLRWAGKERLILRSDRVDHVALIRLLGKQPFTEVSGWIHEQIHQRAFEARAQLEQLRVPDHQRLVGVEFEHEGFRGELAIPDWSPGEAVAAKLSYCFDRRVVQELELHAALPIIGLVDDEHAELNANFSAVLDGSARIAKLRGALTDLIVERLLPELARRYPSLDARQQSLARSWIFAHLRRKSPRGGAFPKRLDEPGRAFAALPLFRDTDGRARTLAELSERYASAAKTLWYVERHPGHALEPPFAVVEARAELLDLLEEMFPRVRDFSARWAARVEGERRREAAPALPEARVPDDALSATTLGRHGFEGALWLPAGHPFPNELQLGVDGKRVETLALVPELPARGVVSGELEADDRFELIELSSAHRSYLRARIIYLYSNMLNQHRRDMARADRPDFMDAEVAQLRLRRVTQLRAAAVAMAQARVRGEGFDAILGNLERRLEHEPLLKMSSGRMISVELARQVRPVEFAHLGIWDPDLPPVDPSERARLLLGESEDEAKPASAKLEAETEEQAEEPAEPEPEASEASEVSEPAEAAEPAEPSGASPEPEPEPAAPEPAQPDEEATTTLGDLFESMDALADSEVGAELELELDAVIEDLKEELMPEPEVDPADVLLERVRAELRLLRDQHEVVLAEGLLDKIQAEARGGKRLVVIDEGVHFDRAHPSFVRAMQDPDPVWVSFLASTAYTALNTWLEAITDAHEVAFHDAHARLLLSAMLDGA